MVARSTRIVRTNSNSRFVSGAKEKCVDDGPDTEEKGSRPVLDRYQEIPTREGWLYENKTALAKVHKGLKDAKEGNVKSVGKLTKSIDG
jgi:hypothetical protein